MLAAILAVDTWMARANLLDIVAEGALFETVQLSFETGFEIDLAFADGSGERFHSRRRGLHLLAKPLDLVAGLVAIGLQLGVERGLDPLQFGGAGVSSQSLPESL